MLPQYRDTAIMVYDWFLHGKICRRIQLMNRWVCLVIYGASRKKFLATPVEIDGYQLAKSNGIRLHAVCSQDGSKITIP